MIDQKHAARSASSVRERPWTPTLAERTGLDDRTCAQPVRADGLGSGVRLVLGLVYLGSALISVTAVVLIIQWVTRS